MLGTLNIAGAGGNSGDGADAVMGSSGDEKGGLGDSYEGDRSSAGNRWPRQETLALLKIRSDMDAAFRDSSLKGPLWEQISRKMMELGYHRSGKKCKEKFENVYKYHKRTKDGRVAKPDGKNYRFFDQLQAFDHNQQHSNYASLPPPGSQSQAHSEEGEEAVPVTMLMPAGSIHHHVTVTSTATDTAPTAVHHQNMDGTNNNVIISSSNNQMPPQPLFPPKPGSATQSSSSSTSSDNDEAVTGSRKRKWKELFERMTKEVINKQEDLQRRFMEAVEKRDRDRSARDEAWKAQELARLKREHEILVQERSMAAAKDAALMSFLQNISQQRNIPFPLPLQPPPPSLPPTQQPQPAPKTNGGNHEDLLFQSGGGGGRGRGGSLSRWPKAEVEALINLRTNMDSKYQENTPKGPLWEEISSAMKKIGYNRNSKRCKEKWENINKYFKKVKESSKKRREDSKTCPYFHQLDALYRHKTPKLELSHGQPLDNPLAADPGGAHGMDDSEDYEDEEEEDDESGGFEIVANNNNNNNNGGGTTGGSISISTTTATAE